MYTKVKKQLFISLGFAFVALGFVGIFIPLLPTTPFVLLAGYFFSKSSVLWHNWLLSTPYIGESIKNWHNYKIISVSAKLFASVTILISFGLTLIFVKVSLFIKFTVALMGIALLSFILIQRSSPLKVKNSRSKSK